MALWLTGNTHHGRLRGTVDISIQQTHLRTLGGQCQCQVHRGGGFAYPALAARDGNYVFYVVHQLHAALHRMRNDLHAHVDMHLSHTGNRAQGSINQLLDGIDLCFRGVAELDIKRHLAAVDLDIFCRFTGNEVFAGIGVNHAR